MVNGLSLFSNVGIAETYLDKVGIKIVVANELIKERADFYKCLYPKCKMICGDITDPEIFKEIINEAKKRKVQFLIATPPCQGMSLAGKKDENDERNYLITYVVSSILNLKPKYVFLENVLMQLKTSIFYKGKKILIPDYLKLTLGKYYRFNKDQHLDTKFYGVPQQRKRAVFLLVRKDVKKTWEFPEHERIITLKEAIGDLPSLDPLIKEKEYRYHFPDYDKKRKIGLKTSKWHYARQHVWRNVECMLHTPTGQSARKNKIYYPKKPDGTMNGGAPRTYMRMDWDKPAPTITIFNHTISSFQNVHPGRYNKKTGLYSDPRVLTIFELMRVMTLPDNWNIPEWASESLIRTVIGEGIPPLAVKKIVKVLGIK